MSNYFERKEREKNREDRPSWRERDAKKDGKNESPSKPSFKTNQQKRNEGVAKKALDDLFTQKKNPEQKAAWKKVSSSRGRDFQIEAENYIKKFNLPKEFDDLLYLIDIRSLDLVSKVLSSIEGQLEHISPTQKELAIGKVKVALLTHEDPDIIDRLQELFQLLS